MNANGTTREPIAPDGVIPPRRQLPQTNVLTEAALLLPRLVLLLGRLLRDRRVPVGSKLLLVGTIGYLISPIDLIPEMIPIIGWADDVVLVSFALSHLLHSVGEDVLREMWDGPDDFLDVVRRVTDFGADLVPARVRKLLTGFTR